MKHETKMIWADTAGGLVVVFGILTGTMFLIIPLIVIVAFIYYSRQ
jgi:hypothetical protein